MSPPPPCLVTGGMLRLRSIAVMSRTERSGVLVVRLHGASEQPDADVGRLSPRAADAAWLGAQEGEKAWIKQARLALF